MWPNIKYKSAEHLKGLEQFEIMELILNNEIDYESLLYDYSLPVQPEIKGHFTINRHKH